MAKGEMDRSIGDLFVTLRQVAEPFLKQLGLSVEQIEA